ncbi:MAG TPA: carbohydrate ABC transporter permease [Rugosimonospora sp.]
MTSSGTALGLRAPRRLTSRRGGRMLVRAVLFLVVIGIFVVPLWSMLATAFSGGAPRLGQVFLWPHGLSAGNLTTAWRFGLGRGLVNSIVVEVIGLTLQVTVSAFAAYALARRRFRGAGLVMLAILATMMMPEEIIAIPLYLVLGKINLLDNYGGLALPLVGWALPVYVLTGFMKRIPVELEEAARVDGAGDLRIFLQVILPLCLPALGTCAVFGFLMIWDQYLLPLLVAQSPKMSTLTLIVTSLQASQEQGEGVRLAAAVVLMVPSVLVYLGLQRLFERGLLSGSLKG